MPTGNGETLVSPPGDDPVEPFFIPATDSLQEQRLRTLKHGDTFAVFERSGDVLSGVGSPEGVFHRDTRYLSHVHLLIAGARPILLSSTVRDDNATLSCDLTNPDVFDADGQLLLEHDLLHIRRSRFLWNATCYERLVLRNFDGQQRQVTLELAFAADFADLFEVRGAKRARRGTKLPPNVGRDRVVLAYRGLDGRERVTTLGFTPAPDRLTAERALFTLELKPREAHSLYLEVACGTEHSWLTPGRAFFGALREARRAQRMSLSRAASITTSNEIFNEAVQRSVSDLNMLITNTPEGPFPYAGIPWFSTVFGRDALITAMEMLWMDPAIARGVLNHLAVHQATIVDPAADAEPGKILHEVRHGEMAELGEVPFRRYYGSVDATPLFVMLAGAYLARTGDLGTVRRLWPSVEAALAWIERYGDRDEDGFVEYARQTSAGLVNQGWKDSHDSVFHADGTLAHGPIALAEVQAYTYGAWTAGATIARRLGHADDAARLQMRADALRRAFDQHFFVPELGTYALALDGDKRPCLVRTSNAGHALFAGIAYPERAASVAATLMAPGSFCGWGIRTVTASAARYNPMSYHNGSVWPHDNALIAAGLARYGFKHHAARIFEGLFGVSIYIDLRRLPELFCGFRRQRTHGPTPYPVACTPQAWAAAAPLFMLQSCLGLGFDADALRITFEEPVLPAFLGEVVLRNLALADTAVDIALRRSGQQVVVDALARRGPIRVLTTT
ncbi:Amylo-alpha-1,6-glucosidase [Luteitalea pratensis]|uniref:Amylo-alpha-1,6-glucosidase n=1 Tax=Luteitalea pratensis TaxID=1855912 RepID=A0A143PUW6_LUTPR|nr:amylo-alpha-1,6-glucosidase [Luteitalea pratensis]AMY11860.1 Amylo-alpha-1,6-glucosidase [Luteitalea pratensis]